MVSVNLLNTGDSDGLYLRIVMIYHRPRLVIVKKKKGTRRKWLKTSTTSQDTAWIEGLNGVNCKKSTKYLVNIVYWHLELGISFADRVREQAWWNSLILKLTRITRSSRIQLIHNQDRKPVGKCLTFRIRYWMRNILWLWATSAFALCSQFFSSRQFYEYDL